jgi:hypothetical protein
MTMQIAPQTSTQTPIDRNTPTCIELKVKSCAAGTPVTCTASDACHVAGTCNPQSGQCSNPTAPDGRSCSDGNVCTQTDTCQAGTCSGANPVTCTASDACHVAGACDPQSGQCSNPNAPDGISCSDGNVCTQTDACQEGTCVGADPVTCTALDACHVAGTCNPLTGCSSPTAPDGTGVQRRERLHAERYLSDRNVRGCESGHLYRDGCVSRRGHLQSRGWIVLESECAGWRDVQRRQHLHLGRQLPSRGMSRRPTRTYR